MADLGDARSARCGRQMSLLRALRRAVCVAADACAGNAGRYDRAAGAGDAAVSGLELSPVVFRKARATIADGKCREMGADGFGDGGGALVGIAWIFGSASVLFAAAFGVLIDDVSDGDRIGYGV